MKGLGTSTTYPFFHKNVVYNVFLFSSINGRTHVTTGMTMGGGPWNHLTVPGKPSAGPWNQLTVPGEEASGPTWNNNLAVPGASLSHSPSLRSTGWTQKNAVHRKQNYEIPGFVLTKPSWDWDKKNYSRPGRV